MDGIVRFRRTPIMLIHPSRYTEKHSSRTCSRQRQKEVLMSDGEWWLVFGVVAGLLPAYLLVRTVLHVLNIPVGRSHRRRG